MADERHRKHLLVRRFFMDEASNYRRVNRRADSDRVLRALDALDEDTAVKLFDLVTEYNALHPPKAQP